MAHLPRFLCVCLLLTALAACRSHDGGGADSNLPPALGNAGEVLFVTDSALWAGPVGAWLRDLFQAPTPGLITGEPSYFVQRVSPQELNRFLRLRKNLIFVHTFSAPPSAASRQLDAFFSDATRTRAATDSNFRTFFRHDVYAQGQTALYLFADTEAQLLQTLERRGQAVIARFRDEEITGIQEALLAGTRQNRPLTQQLRADYGYTLRVPNGYQVASQRADFVWLRNAEAVLDRNLFVARRPYTSEAQFSPDSVLAWRDAIGRTSIFGSGAPDTTSYLMTEYYVPPTSRPVNFGGAYALETRGLWKLKNNRMGGPFVSYVVLDADQQNLYYLEGFLYAPDRKKRDYLRELEALLYTFRTSATADTTATAG